MYLIKRRPTVKRRAEKEKGDKNMLEVVVVFGFGRFTDLTTSDIEEFWRETALNVFFFFLKKNLLFNFSNI